MVWLGSIQIRSLPFGFSLTSILDSQSVGWVTGLIISLLQKAFSALDLPGLTSPQALGVLGHETGVTEGSSWIWIGVPRGFPRHGLDTLTYCRKMLMCLDRGRIVWLPYVLILLLVFETFKLGNNWLNKLLGMVLQVEAESICALTIFDFPSWTRCKWAQMWCFAFCYKRLLICIIINEIWLLLVACLLSCSSFTCTSEVTNDSTLITSLTERRAMMLTRTGMAATSRCLWPLPVSFTRKVSDVKPAINWSHINSSVTFSYSHCEAWFRIRVSQEPIDSS